MSADIVIDASEPSHKLSREAYHGGRVECFKLGLQQFRVTGVDINSMYPAVMREHDYPARLIAHYDTQAKGRWAALLDRYCIVARCRIHAKAPCYPTIENKRLAFPTGEIETVLCTPELALALERGELLDMWDIVVYEKAPLFKEFVDYMWAQRLAAAARGDEVAAWLFKILMNSLYGKFGQTGIVYQTSDTIKDLRSLKFTIIDHDTKKVMQCRQMGGLLQVLSSEGEARDSFPAIAAHVTSHARVLLWRYLERAKLRNVLYSDTDSLYLTAAGARNLQRDIAPGELGKLKQTGVYEFMHIHGPKDYELPTQVVRKGVRANAQQIAPNTFKQTQWSSLKGLVELGDTTAPRRKEIVKVLARAHVLRKRPA